MSELSAAEALLEFERQRMKVAKVPGDAKTAKWWRTLAKETEELARRAARVADELDGKVSPGAATAPSGAHRTSARQR